MSTLNIRNMVCRHCIGAVEDILRKLHIPFTEVRVGSADIDESCITDDKLEALDSALALAGFERVIDNDTLLVEKTKHAVIHHVRDEDECRLNLSACIEKMVGVPYDTISRIFSQKEGRTIEKYHIAQKIELVKELIGYGDMTLSEIAYRTGYSSAAHLSRQFKQATGLTPSEYLKSSHSRTPINEV